MIMPFEVNIILVSIISSYLAIISIWLAKQRNTLNAIIPLSLFSSLACLLYLLMDAPDVAMTEAALGACITTIIFLLVIKHCGTNEKSPSPLKQIVAGIFCSCVFALLSFASTEFLQYGEPTMPVHLYSGNLYIEYTNEQIGIPSFVAAILASYRGFDTLGETAVIFVAAIAVLLIMQNQKTDGCHEKK